MVLLLLKLECFSLDSLFLFFHSRVLSNEAFSCFLLKKTNADRRHHCFDLRVCLPGLWCVEDKCTVLGEVKFS